MRGVFISRTCFPDGMPAGRYSVYFPQSSVSVPIVSVWPSVTCNYVSQLCYYVSTLIFHLCLNVKNFPNLGRASNGYEQQWMTA